MGLLGASDNPEQLVASERLPWAGDPVLDLEVFDGSFERDGFVAHGTAEPAAFPRDLLRVEDVRRLGERGERLEVVDFLAHSALARVGAPGTDIQ